MPTVQIIAPLAWEPNVIDGIKLGVADTHDPNVTYDGIYYCGFAGDTVYDTNANSWIWANVYTPEGYQNRGNDVFYGRGGDDVLVGFWGDDMLDGGDDNDILIGDTGDDTLVGGNGFDQLWGGPGCDRLNGGDGTDWIISGGGGTAATPEILWGGDHDASRDILIGIDGSVERYFTSGNSTVNPADGSATDIVWYFNLAEDILAIRGAGAGSINSDYDHGLGVTYYDNYAGTGLSGTLLTNGVETQGVMFFAGLNATREQLLARIDMYYDVP